MRSSIALRVLYPIGDRLVGQQGGHTLQTQRRTVRSSEAVSRSCTSPSRIRTPACALNPSSSALQGLRFCCRRAHLHSAAHRDRGHLVAESRLGTRLHARIEGGLALVLGINGLVAKQALTSQELLHAPSNVHQEGCDLGLRRRLQRMEREFAVGVLGEHTVEEHDVEMDVEVQRAAESLGKATAPVFGRGRPACFAARRYHAVTTRRNSRRTQDSTVAGLEVRAAGSGPITHIITPEKYTFALTTSIEIFQTSFISAANSPGNGASMPFQQARSACTSTRTSNTKARRFPCCASSAWRSRRTTSELVVRRRSVLVGA